MAQLPAIESLIRMNHSNMWQLLFHEIPYSWDIVESNAIYRHSKLSYIFGTFSLVYLSSKHPYYDLPESRIAIYGYPIDCVGVIWERVYFPWHLLDAEKIQELRQIMTQTEFDRLFDADIKYAATKSPNFPKHWLKISYTNIMDPTKPETAIVKLPKSYRQKDLDLVLGQLDSIYAQSNPAITRSEPIPIPMTTAQSQAKEMARAGAPKRDKAIPRRK